MSVVSKIQGSIVLIVVFDILPLTVSVALRFSRRCYKIPKYTPAPAVRSKILSKLISASCVCYSERACYGGCVLNKGIYQVGRRPPLELACTRVMLINLCMGTPNPVIFREKKSDGGCGTHKFVVCPVVYPVVV